MFSEPGLYICFGDIFLAGEHIDFVVAMTIELGTKLQRLDTKAHRLFNLLALFDAVKQMAFGPIVGMVFCYLFKELYTIHVPTNDVITHFLIPKINAV
jgi:hypothetical protein